LSQGGDRGGNVKKKAASQLRPGSVDMSSTTRKKRRVPARKWHASPSGNN